MQINNIRHGHQRYDEFKPEKPYQVRPVVVKEFVKDGVAFIKTKCKRTFVADTFYKIFGRDEKGTLKNKFYKGENPCRLLELTTK